MRRFVRNYTSTAWNTSHDGSAHYWPVQQELLQKTSLHITYAVPNGVAFVFTNSEQNFEWLKIF